MPSERISVGRPSFLKKLFNLGDGSYADAAVLAATEAEAETVVAGAASVLGKTGTVAAGVQLLARIDCSDEPWSRVLFRVKSDKSHSVTLYRGRTLGVTTLTVASLGDTETILGGGLTFTAESTAADVAYLTRKFSSAGDDTADAASLKKAINPGTAITLASVEAGDLIVVNGLTYTAHADTTTEANREFSIAGTDAQDATELAVCLNNATYGCGVTVEANGAVVTYEGTTVTATGNARAVVSTWAGVPGVVATSALGVVTVTPTTATAMQWVTGTAGAHCVVASTQLALLSAPGSAVPGLAADTTTAGPTHELWLDGFPQAFIGVTNNDGAQAATFIVGATRIP